MDGRECYKNLPEDEKQKLVEDSLFLLLDKEKYKTFLIFRLSKISPEI